MTADRATRRTLAQAANDVADGIMGSHSSRARWPLFWKAPNRQVAAHIAANDPETTLADLDALDRADRIEAAARDLLRKVRALDWWDFRYVELEADALRRALDGDGRG